MAKIRKEMTADEKRRVLAKMIGEGKKVTVHTARQSVLLDSVGLFHFMATDPRNFADPRPATFLYSSIVSAEADEKKVIAPFSEG